METQERAIVTHPAGELPMVEAQSAIADTFAGRVHVEWDTAAPVTSFGQLPFFSAYLKQAGLFDAWVADCPLSLTSPNTPRKRDLLGTVLLSVLAGHRRYPHITAVGGDRGTPPLLGMRMVLSEDAVRRNLGKIEEAPGLSWLQGHLDYSVAPLLDEPWVLDDPHRIADLAVDGADEEFRTVWAFDGSSDNRRVTAIANKVRSAMIAQMTDAGLAEIHKLYRCH